MKIAKPNVVIAYVRQAARHAESAQRTVLAPLAPSRVVVDTIDGDRFDTVARSVRNGDVVAVAHIHLLASTVGQIEARIRAVHDRGGAVIEAATGRRSDVLDDAISLMGGARSALAADKRTHSKAEARRKGKRGAKASAEAKPPWKTQFSPAMLRALRAIWKSREYATNAAALDAMNEHGGIDGWSLMLAWRMFGASGRPGGRRRKSKT